MIQKLIWDQIYDGYSKSLENAESFWDIAQYSIKENPHIALALFELGQEEIGKSWLFLQAFSFLGESGLGDSWECFWRSFKDHEKKVRKSYFYEWVSPIRFSPKSMIKINDKGEDVSELSLFEKISKEKELGFYVDFDGNKFSLPKDKFNLSKNKSVSIRSAAFVSLLSVAIHLKALLDTNKEQYYELFSILPKRLEEEYPVLYVQDVLKFWDQISIRSPAHKSFVQDLLGWKVSYEENIRSLF